jgi:hypothetical protein
VVADAPAKTVSAPPPPAEPAEVALQASTVATEVDFNTLKKAFLALSTKEGPTQKNAKGEPIPYGRFMCEGVLATFGVVALSLAKPEQYADIHAAILKASK